MPEKVSISSRFTIQEKICQSSQEPRYSLKIIFSKIENIAWWRMTVVDFLCFWFELLYGIETISRKNHGIVVSEKLGTVAESIPQYLMPEAFHKYRFPERDDTLLKSQCPRIETPL